VVGIFTIVVILRESRVYPFEKENTRKYIGIEEL